MIFVKGKVYKVIINKDIMKFDYQINSKYGSFGGLTQYTLVLTPENDEDKAKIRDLEKGLNIATNIYGDLIFKISSTSENTKDESLRLKSDTEIFKPA